MLRTGVLLLSFAVFLSACAKMYPSPEVDRAINFMGVRDIVPPGGTARMVLSHGMCSGSHDVNWVVKRLKHISEIVAATEPAEVSAAELESNAKSSGNGAVKLYEANVNGSEGRNYQLSFIVWGRAVDQARAQLDNDSGRAPQAGQPRRAALNSTLKSTLMNDCLVDAVVYLGPAGNVIREGTREIWCKIFGGQVRNSNGRLDDTTTCDVRPSHSTAPDAVFLVPESLGAKVMFDAFRQVEVIGTTKAQALGPVGGLHFVTNQVLLLDQAGLSERTGENVLTRSNESSLSSFIAEVDPINSLARTSSNNVTAPVPIVGYTDPNDVLGYRLLEQQTPEGKDFEVINVLLSNTETAFPFWPLLANPIAAHRGAEDVDDIFRMIIDGADQES